MRKGFILLNIHNFVNIENFDQEIRDALAKIFIKLGVRDADASILAEIIKSDQELTVDDLARRLNYSISGVTSSLHRLMRMHLIVRRKRGRKYIYRSESNMLSTLLHLIEDIREHELMDLLKKIEKSLEIKEDEGIKNLKEKVKSADKYLLIVSGILREYSEGGM